jgi:hypothetical protein
MTIKPSLLATAVAAISALSVHSAMATSFLPMDARGLAMGDTGVASAKRAHAPAYNPSLLSQARSNDDFAIIFPSVGIVVADEEELIDSANDIADITVPKFEDLFDDASSNNFTSAVNDVQVSSTALVDELNSLGNSDGRTDAQKANDLRTANQNFADDLNEVDKQLSEVNSVTKELTDALNSISGDPIRGRAGVGMAVAMPGKKFAAALSVNADVHFSGRTIFTGTDQNLITAYGVAAQGYLDIAQAIPTDIGTLADDVEAGASPTDIQTAATSIQDSLDEFQTYTSDDVETADGFIKIFEGGEISNPAEDPNLDSRVEIIAMAIADVGLSFSREFTIANRKVAIGVTPKLQKIETYHYITEADNEDDIETSDIEDSRATYNHINLDIGASMRFGASNQWMLGVVAKNLIAKDFDLSDAPVQGNTNNLVIEGDSVSLKPQYRAGVSYSNNWVTLAGDLDLVENDPIAYEQATQYAAIGAEFDLYETVQLRAGYRTNLSASNSEVVSIGFGLSPFGLHIDIAALANPSDYKKEAGVALETGFYF